MEEKNTAVTGSGSVYYPDYLQLDKVLGAQAPESEKAGVKAHDELLFIIIHQTYELWFKQILHEVGSVIEIFEDEHVDDNGGELNVAVHRMERVHTILQVLVHQIDILETMTPLEFSSFRERLEAASGRDQHQGIAEQVEAAGIIDPAAFLQPVHPGLVGADEDIGGCAVINLLGKLRAGGIADPHRCQRLPGRTGVDRIQRRLQAGGGEHQRRLGMDRTDGHQQQAKHGRDRTCPPVSPAWPAGASQSLATQGRWHRQRQRGR